MSETLNPDPRRELVGSLEHHPEYQDDKEMVLRALESDCTDLQFASDRIRDDKDVVLAAIDHDPRAVKYATERLQKDDDIVAAVKETQHLEEHGRIEDVPSDWQGS